MWVYEWLNVTTDSLLATNGFDRTNRWTQWRLRSTGGQSVLITNSGNSKSRSVAAHSRRDIDLLTNYCKTMTNALTDWLSLTVCTQSTHKCFDLTHINVGLIEWWLTKGHRQGLRCRQLSARTLWTAKPNSSQPLTAVHVRHDTTRAWLASLHMSVTHCWRITIYSIGAHIHQKSSKAIKSQSISEQTMHYSHYCLPIASKNFHQLDADSKHCYC